MEQTLLEAINGIKKDIIPIKGLENNQNQTDQVKALEENIKESEVKLEGLKKELDYVRNLNMWQFRKWKQEKD